jgi:hypothetical protein
VTGAASIVEAGRRRPVPSWSAVPAAQRSVPALDGRGTMTDFSRPLVLGYVREHLLITPGEVDQTKAALNEFAESQGFLLGTVYVEKPHTEPVQFQALMVAIERYAVKHVVVPSLAHVQPLDAPSNKDHLEHHSSATVLPMRSP